ncbi:hypothetical protein B6228_01475 [Candidatus Atribacteria bacterium 4572_76]|nr:MAG: hypothetical protein B6228_01475 [Candidatus Atribacteria bacterium 4572_76]
MSVPIICPEAICRELNCQPGDLLEYHPDEKNKTE